MPSYAGSLEATAAAAAVYATVLAEEGGQLITLSKDSHAVSRILWQQRFFTQALGAHKGTVNPADLINWIPSTFLPMTWLMRPERLCMLASFERAYLHPSPAQGPCWTLCSATW